MRASPPPNGCRALVAADFFGAVGYSAPEGRGFPPTPVHGREVGSLGAPLPPWKGALGTALERQLRRTS